MKGADIIFCYMNETTGNGVCEDRYAADVGIPALGIFPTLLSYRSFLTSLDIDLGGLDDLTNVFFSQADGFTYVNRTPSLFALY